MISTVFAAGKEAKQQVECSVNSEEAAQLEIGLDPLAKFEEEEKTAKGTFRMKVWVISTRAFLNTQ